MKNLVILCVVAMCLGKKHQKMNPADRIKEQHTVHRTIDQLALEHAKNKAGDALFHQDKLGRDKSVQAKASERVWFMVEHENDEECSESALLNRPALMNQHNVYFTENDMSYRNIIGGFEIARAVPSGLWGDLKDFNRITVNIKKIKKTLLTTEKFKGYCFKTVLPDQKWTICHQNKKVLEKFRNHLRVQAILNYMHSRGLHHPAFLQK